MNAIDRRYSVSEGTAFKAPCLVATTANITLGGLQVVDGVTVVEHDRVLVKDQTNASLNGIYEASSGNWQRTKDFDGARDIVHGTKVYVSTGAHSHTEYTVTSSDPITVGTSAITFTAASDTILAQAQAAASQAAIYASMLSNAVHVYDVRADALADTIPLTVKNVIIKREAAGYPLANATYVVGTVSGPRAFLNNGQYWELDLTNTILDLVWFAANPPNAAANAAAFAAIAALSTDGGTTGYSIRVGPGQWQLTGAGAVLVSFTKQNNRIIGAGKNLTFINFVPTEAFQTAFQWYLPGSAGGLSYCGISGVRIVRDKTAYPAVALDTVNTSGFQYSDVAIHNWHDTTSKSSIGILLRGREITTIDRVDCTADYPIFIDENPERSKVLRIDCDFLSIRNAQLSSATSDAGHSPIFIRDGVNVTNFSIDNFDVSGASHGIEWTTTGNNIALAQSRGSAGNLVLNGSLVTAGVGAFLVPRQVGITAPTTDNSGVTFTVTGTSSTGAPLVNTILAGPNQTTKFTADDFATITSIATSAATVGNVIAGKAPESVNFIFTVKNGRQEQVATPGGALVLIDRQSVFELRGVKVEDVEAGNTGLHFTGNIAGISVNTIYHASATYPPFVIDASVGDFTWGGGCEFQSGAPSGIAAVGRTTIFQLDQRSGEPHARSGKSVKAAFATLPVQDWNAPAGTQTRGTFTVAGATTASNAQAIAALIADLKTLTGSS